MFQTALIIQFKNGKKQLSRKRDVARIRAKGAHNQPKKLVSCFPEINVQDAASVRDGFPTRRSPHHPLLGRDGAVMSEK